MSRPANAVLGDVLIEVSPGFACGDDAADGVFQFRMNNITTEGQLDLSKKRRVPRDSRNIDRYLVESGDVLFNATNSPDLVGKTAYFPGFEEPAVFSNHFLRLRPDADRLDGRFLSRWLNVQFQRGRFKGMCRQWVNQATVNRDALLAMQIRLPPLPEQRRIAGILNKADALRAKRRAALAQLDTLIQSIFLDMFGDPVINPMKWEMRSIGDLAVEKPNNGIFRRNPEYSESLDSGLPVVWVAELFRGTRIDVSESRRLEANQAEIEKYGLLPGDLLFCRSSLKLDGIAYNNVFLGEPEQALFECHLIRVSLRTDVVNPMFLNLQLRSGPMRAVLKSKSKTATMTTIDQKALSSVGVVVPPIGLQNRFAAIVESIEQQKAHQRAHLAEIDTLFASLQYRAFRGEL